MPSGNANGLLLGVDVGTTETKAVATTLDGRVLSVGSGPTPWNAREPGGADISPEALFGGVVAACADAVERALGYLPSGPSVHGIGVTGMAEAGVLLERSGHVADLPIIAWFDPRGGEEFAALDPSFLAAFPAQSGLPVSPVATFAKLLWMRRELGFDLTGHRWLNVPEFVIHALGGEAATEPSLASRTGLFDQDEMTPFTDALAVLDATEGLLPPLVPAGTGVGTASGDIPTWLKGAILTVAGHDHPVASLAAGATGPDDLFDSCGTAEALLRATTRRITHEERTALSRHNVSQGAHVLPGRRMLLGGTRGGLLLRRILATLGATEPAARDALDRACPTGDIGSLPVHIDGGRLDEQRVWLRIDSDDAAPPLVWRAALEVVAEQARAMVDIFESVAGPAERMVAAGGWTRASSYRAIKERTFPGILFADLEQAGGLGAAAVASFAASGVDTIDDLPVAIERFIAS